MKALVALFFYLAGFTLILLNSNVWVAAGVLLVVWSHNLEYHGRE